MSGMVAISLRLKSSSLPRQDLQLSTRLFLVVEIHKVMVFGGLTKEKPLSKDPGQTALGGHL